MSLSLFPENMKQKIGVELTFDTIVSKIVYFQEQTQLLHWQTSSYAEHQALGGLYEYIQGFKDDIVEKLMGYTGKKPVGCKIETMNNVTSLQVVTELMSFASKLKMYGEQNSFHDICNMADELSGKSAKTKYLLTLS